MEITVAYHGKMKFTAQCGSHEVTIDLPPESGGEDTAATPPQLFLVSLASCIGVYVAGYCANAGIESSGMTIAVKAQKMMNPARLEGIRIDVRLPNAELGRRRDAVLAVAKKCLIHNTIAAHPSMDIAVQGKGEAS